MEEKQCEKCKELNEKLGIKERGNYEAICNDCWNKRVDKRKAIEKNEIPNLVKEENIKGGYGNINKDKNDRQPFWNENGCCKDCGGKVEYDFSLNKISCETCENEITAWM